jgi:hypothetical protein
MGPISASIKRIHNVNIKTIALAVSIAAIAFKGAEFLVRKIEVPLCHSDEATRGLVAALKASSLGTIAINNAVTISGGILSDERQCAADIAELRGGVDAADMHWMRVTYQVKNDATSGKADVTAKLGGEVPLAPVRSSLAQWMEWFLH